MRKLKILDKYRDTHSEYIKTIMGGDAGGDDYGRFFIPCRQTGVTLQAIASSGDPPHIMWEHVSVSLPSRCPLWVEMCFIKDLFFEPHETVMQLHVPKEDHVNFHPYCLHLWKPIDLEIPRPPSILVGPK
jgi:hypothetical protein